MAVASNGALAIGSVGISAIASAAGSEVASAAGLTGADASSAAFTALANRSAISLLGAKLVLFMAVRSRLCTLLERES